MIHRHRFLSMGTMVTLTISCSRWTARRAIVDAFAEVQQRMDAFARDFWAFGDGRLAEINRGFAASGVMDIPRDMRTLFDRAGAIRDATDGLFDPCVGALVRAWGFDDPARMRVAPPSEREIAAALAMTAWDFGAIGKGFIVDECLDRLAARGFAHASIDAGGNVAVRGRHGDRPWRIGVRDPRADRNDELIAALDAGDESVITHGDDQRYFVHRGVRYSHILDPRTGWPARGLRSVTVVHRDGALADAAGAALFVAGAQWRALASKLGLDQVLAITETGAIDVTQALAERVRLRDRRYGPLGGGAVPPPEPPPLPETTQQ